MHSYWTVVLYEHGIARPLACAKLEMLYAMQASQLDVYATPMRYAQYIRSTPAEL